MFSTGGALKKTALVCKRAKASAIFATATHGLLIGRLKIVELKRSL
jgi:hypothetical protein